MRWLKQLVTRQGIYNDLSEEIEQHLAEKTEALMAEGMSREDAERAARREFGNVTRIHERGREAWMWPLAESLWADMKFAFRQLTKSPGFALTAILTIALGIGATTAIFSLVNAVLLRPLPFPEQDRLMWLSLQDHSLPGVVPQSVSYPDYFDWRAQNHTFESMASYAQSPVILQQDGDAQRMDAQVVSSNFFQLLGVAPMLGRDFNLQDEKPGNRAVMLSYALWQSNFGGSKNIVGKTIQMDDEKFVVAGVMPRGFQFPLENPGPALWKSIADDADGTSPKTVQRGFNVLAVIGRLKTGATLDQARADMNLVAGNLAREYPDNDKQFSSALVEPELAHMTGDVRPALRILFGAVTLMLLIVCANVAGLLLARGSRRHAEFALRAAIGASRTAIVRQLLVESVTLSVCGGAAGVALAYGLVQAAERLMPLDIPRMNRASIDGSVLLFDLAVSLVAGIAFGLLPALRMARSTPAQALREGSRTVAGVRGQNRLHNGLVIAQTAIGMVLLIGSGLLVRSFIRIVNVDPGFDSKHVLTMRAGVSFLKMQHDQHFLFYQQMLARIAAVPGVGSASAGWPLPMNSSNVTVSFNIQGRPMAKGDEPSESLGVIMPGYFETMRTPLIAGRTFDERDGLKGPATIVINQAFAKKYFPHENPLGQHIQVRVGDDVFNSPMREVVGVVGDIKRKGLTAEADPQYYLPFAQAVITNPYMVIRTNVDPMSVQGAVAAAIHELDKSVPLYQVSTMDEIISKSTAQPRFQTFLLTGFAAIALVLAAIGLYGLLSYIVVQRTLEIGLRMALGAQRRDVLGMIVKRGFMLALLGVAAGLAASAMLTRLMATMLFRVHPFDPLTFAVTSALLLVVGVAASSVPAYRAAQMDPMKTLREQ
ncbi:MAG: ABC transporter permease [Terracidiphilus sp.]